MKILCIRVPDEGEWVVVPKVATDETLNAAREAIWQSEGIQLSKEDYKLMHAAVLAAAPPCKEVELPAAPAHLEHNEVKAWYACLDDIERRAKTLA